MSDAVVQVATVTTVAAPDEKLNPAGMVPMTEESSSTVFREGWNGPEHPKFIS